MTNIEKAKALIGSFTTGNLAVAEEVLTDGYIQHNLAFGTGKGAFINAVKGLAEAPVKTTVNNIRAQVSYIQQEMENLIVKNNIGGIKNGKK